jgi:uncharacterized membrane protein YeaQ/YmgE (transglycosylase-associated protein family)
VLQGGLHGHPIVHHIRFDRRDLAKFFMPGKDPGGFIVTILIGIAGAIVGGFIGDLLGFGTVTGFNLRSFFVAIVGAMLLLLIYRFLKKAA